MVDIMNFTIPLVPPQFLDQVREPVNIFGIDCSPYYAANGMVSGYKGTENKVTLQVNGRGVSLQVGWHTHHSDSNHTDYCRSHMVETFNELYDVTQGLIDDAYVFKLESGVNVEHVDISTWMRYNGNVFESMIMGNKSYGKKIRLTDRDFKAYDKTFERKKQCRLNIGADITRIETKLKNKAAIKRIGIFTPRDLLKVEVLNQLSILNQKQIQKITMVDKLRYSELSLSQLKLVTMMTECNQEQLEHYKSFKESYKKDRQKFKAIVKDSCNIQQDYIIGKIGDKFDLLINS